jgi:hypothetical protein
MIYFLKWEFFFLTFLTSLFCFAQSGNLVENPNFERTSTNSISGWTTSCAQPVRLTQNYAKFDRSSLEIVDDRNDRSCSAYSKAFSVVGGKSYDVEGWARHIDLNGISSTPSFFLKYYGASGSEVGSVSGSTGTQKGVWQRFARTFIAPANAVTAKLLLYSNQASSQTVQFDGVSVSLSQYRPSNEVVLYVAPTARGSGSGNSASNSALYNSSSFWSSVNSKLSSYPVRVIFAAGKYTMNTAAHALSLNSVGHAKNRLKISGEDAYSTQFVSGAAGDQGLSFLFRLNGSRNISIANIHFRTESKYDLGYALLITSGSSDISLENISSVNTEKISYGILGFHKGSSRIDLVGSEFLRVGYDGHQHFIYMFRDVSDINIINNVFEDSTGSYIRCRDTCDSINISQSEFKATGLWGKSNDYKYPHFIEFAVFNDVLYSSSDDQSQQEWFLSGFSATENVFDYAAALGSRAKPFSIYHGGFNPFDGVRFRSHLLSSSDASKLVSGSTSTKRSLLLSKFGLDVNSDFLIHSNQYRNIIYLFELESQALYGADQYYAPSVYAGSGVFNISNLFPNP